MTKSFAILASALLGAGLVGVLVVMRRRTGHTGRCEHGRGGMILTLAAGGGPGRRERARGWAVAGAWPPLSPPWTDSWRPGRSLRRSREAAASLEPTP